MGKGLETLGVKDYGIVKLSKIQKAYYEMEFRK